MWEAIKRWLRPCDHQWEVREEYLVERSNTTRGKLYILQCKKCGSIRKEKVTV